MLSLGQKRQSKTSELLYASAVELARNPRFFEDFGVLDNVDGRFDCLALCVSLVMRRLKELDAEGAALSQQLFDTMFADMDLTLREMGAGDVGVSKRVRVMADAERLEAGVKLQQSAAGAVACREQHFRRPPTERRNDDVRVPHERGV